MRTIKRPPVQIFTLSFLDIISCAFAAIVMLVLLARNGGDETHQGPSAVGEAIAALAVTQQQVAELQSELSDKKAALSSLQQSTAKLETTIQQTNQANARSTEARANAQSTAVSLTEQLRIRQAAQNIVTDAPATEDVGGIPVDAEYVMFIIDTSGSMKSIWPRVVSLIEDVLNNHPQVKGMNFMSDNGEYLYNAYRGRWIEDNPRRRQSVLDAIRRNWNGATNSSPIEGLEETLQSYAKQPRNMAIYVFGDEYSGDSFDRSIARITALNTDPNTQEPIMRIHGVGFLNGSSGNFATLMRGIASQNKGTFIGVNQ